MSAGLGTVPTEREKRPRTYREPFFSYFFTAARSHEDPPPLARSTTPPLPTHLGAIYINTRKKKKTIQRQSTTTYFASRRTVKLWRCVQRVISLRSLDGRPKTLNVCQRAAVRYEPE
uniref:Uncharacterized protein n=1 Tax=Sipha flava TaxID=143950 RepID=A0A2S2R2H3_9HEMI